MLVYCVYVEYRDITMDDIKIKISSDDGVFFDLEEDNDVSIDNFGVAVSAQAPNRYVKNILQIGLSNVDFKFNYVAKRYNEKKALINAIENEYIVCLDEDKSFFQLTKKGFLAIKSR